MVSGRPSAVWLEGWRWRQTEMSPLHMLPCWLLRMLLSAAKSLESQRCISSWEPPGATGNKHMSHLCLCIMSVCLFDWLVSPSLTGQRPLALVLSLLSEPWPVQAWRSDVSVSSSSQHLLEMIFRKTSSNFLLIYERPGHCIHDSLRSKVRLKKSSFFVFQLVNEKKKSVVPS